MKTNETYFGKYVSILARNPKYMYHIGTEMSTRTMLAQNSKYTYHIGTKISTRTISGQFRKYAYI